MLQPRVLEMWLFFLACEDLFMVIFGGTMVGTKIKYCVCSVFVK